MLCPLQSSQISAVCGPMVTREELKTTDDGDNTDDDGDSVDDRVTADQTE